MRFDREVIETVMHRDLRVTYAQIGMRRGTERPTHTSRGQVGVAFTGHEDLVFEANGRVRRTSAAPGVTYLTAEHAIDWLEVHGVTDAVEVQVAPHLLRAAGADRGRNAHAERDAVIFATASRLRAIHRSGGRLSEVAAGEVALHLADHLANRYAGVALDARRRFPMTWREVEVVHAFVRAHLAEPITLDTLATLVHRSSFEFARAFRVTTGTPPHRFVATVRMHTALELMRRGATVTSASAAVGHTNRHHFRRQLHALTGSR